MPNETGPLNGSGGLEPKAPLDWLYRPFAADPNPLQDFKGQTILLVFNPNARQGSFKPHAESLRTGLEGLGFQVEFMMTAADPVQRMALIRGKADELLAKPGVKGLHVFPVGGDGTIDQVVGQVIRSITGPFQQIPPDSRIDQLLRQKIAAVSLAQIGTAADIANQVGAPPHAYRLRSFARGLFFQKPPPPFREIPDFMSRAQRIPMGIASVTAAEVSEQSVFHSVSFGTSGYLFGKAEENRKNPTNPLNRGLLSYFRVLPSSIYHYGLFGVEVAIEHHGRVERFRVGDLMGTASRITGAVGGIPGGWGEFKLLAIPNGALGITTMSEAIVRGVGTKLGFNWVGSDSLFWTLPRDRQITLRPGEEATLRFYDPKTGSPLAVPWQVNGDSVPTRVSEAKVYVPPLSVPVHADPQSLALRLYNADQLRLGLNVYNRDENAYSVFRFLPRPTVIQFSAGRKMSTSPYYPTYDLRNFSSDFGIEVSRLPLLVAKAHGMKDRNTEARFVEEPRAMNDLQSWCRGEAGKKYLAADKALLEDTFANRLRSRGTGLAFGMGAFAGARWILDEMGLQAEQDRFLYFNASALLSHGTNQVASGAATVLANRIRGLPYDWAMMETRSVHGLLASRFVYETEPNLLKAMSLGTLRNLGFQGSLKNVLATGAKGLVTVPARTAWGMGIGIAANRFTDHLSSQYFPENTKFREMAGTAAFFAPSLYGVLAGRQAFAVLESSSMRKINFVFSAGFAADLIYAGVQSVLSREEAPYERWIQHRAAELRDREEGKSLFSWRGIRGLVMPEISAALDGVSDKTKVSSYSEEVKQSDQKMLRDLELALRENMEVALLFGNSKSHHYKYFYQMARVEDLLDFSKTNPLEEKIKASLEGRISTPAWARMNLEERIKYVRDHFSGYALSEEEIAQMVLKWRWKEICQSAFHLVQMHVPGSEKLQSLFDAEGKVHTIVHSNIVQFLGASSEKQLLDRILEKRKTLLLERLESARQAALSGDEEDQAKYKTLQFLAQDLGLIR